MQALRVTNVHEIQHNRGISRTNSGVALTSKLPNCAWSYHGRACIWLVWQRRCKTPTQICDSHNGQLHISDHCYGNLFVHDKRGLKVANREC